MPSEAPPTLRSLAEQELSSSSLFFSESALLAFLLRRFLLYCVAAMLSELHTVKVSVVIVFKTLHLGGLKNTIFNNKTKIISTSQLTNYFYKITKK